MARIDIEQAEVLGYLVRHLRRSLRLDERRCFETLSPLLPEGFSPPGGDWFITVAEGGGMFPLEDQHPQQCMESWSILVTVYTRVKLDRSGHDQQLMVDASRGLLRLKRQVLRAVVGEDLTTDEESPDSARSEFLRSHLHVNHAQRMEYDQAAGIGWLTIELGVEYDWDLT